MLWLALHFAELPLEALAAAGPLAVVAEQRVVAVTAAAHALGVRPGMRLASALGLAPDLAVSAREPAREAATLQRLACWAGRFSPRVVVASPDLLIEIGSCLRLFGGFAALTTQVRAGLAAQGFAPRLAAAPTALAAQWLARVALADAPLARPRLEDLPALLAPLPLAVLELPAAQAALLVDCGLSRVGDLLAQPTAGLWRRCGADLPRRLTQALGREADPRRDFVFPERFDAGLELPARVDAAPALEFAAARLLAALGGWLAVRQAGIRRCHLHIAHEEGAPTRLELGFAAPTHAPDRLARVLHERLQRLCLPAPAVALALHAEEIEALGGQTLPLPANPAAGVADAEALTAVIERLRARLGGSAVHGLGALADHRPECATRALAEISPLPDARPGAPPRPVWLLATPRRLADHALPRRLTAAERIESGWWDAGLPGGVGDVRREYHIALGPQGAWWWIYRDAEGWWLHGVFA